MKFSSTVDSLTKENSNLRTFVKLLAGGIILLGLQLLYLVDKAPLVVERSARGLEIVNVVSPIQSAEEINQAIVLMMRARFETRTKSADLFLSSRQQLLREAEQKEMKSRGLTQAVVVREVKLDKKEATVEFDRVISVGEIRSALKTIAKIAFEEVEPNELNPYGLKLALAEPLKEQEKK